MKKIIFLLAALLIAPFSYAQGYSGVYNGIPTQVTGPFSPWTPPASSSIFPSAATTAEVLDANGVVISKAGSVRVLTKAGEVALPTTVAATATRAGIARALGAVATRVAGPVGVAITIAELAQQLNKPTNQGYQPDPNTGGLAQQEQPGVSGDAPGTGYQYNMTPTTAAKTPDAACQKLSQIWWNGQPSYHADFKIDAALVGTACSVWITQLSNGSTQTIYSRLAVEKLSNFYVPSLQNNLSKDAIEEAILSKMNGDNNVTKRMYDALKQDAQNSGNNWPTAYSPLQPDSPASAKQDPASSPEKTKSTSTTKKPDGSTDTTVTKESTNVTPSPSGSTVSALKGSYNIQTVTNNYTTNSVTNVTTTNTTTVEDGTVEEPDAEDDCKSSDLARCSKLGTVDTEKVPSQDIAATYTPVTFASNASCPQPYAFSLGAFGGQQQLSMQPACDFFSSLRPVILAIAAAGCAFIFASGVSKL